MRMPVRVWLSFLQLLIWTGVSAAQTGHDFPVRPIRVISTVSPGAAQDVLARALSDPYRAKTGYGFVVENRVGVAVLSNSAPTNPTPPEIRTKCTRPPVGRMTSTSEYWAADQINIS